MTGVTGRSVARAPDVAKAPWAEGEDGVMV